MPNPEGHGEHRDFQDGRTELRGSSIKVPVEQSRGRSSSVIGVNVTFQYDGDFDRSRVIGVADNARAMFEGMPGLRFKFFTLDEKQQKASNFYVWESQEAAEGFFTDELRERVTGLYGVAPEVEFLEIAQVVDNSRS
jgi:hypothetical protein